MFQYRSANRESGIIYDQPILLKRLLSLVTKLKPVDRSKGAFQQTTLAYFNYFYGERFRIQFNQVPGEPGQLACHILNNIFRSKNCQRCFPTKKCSQQPVETDEVVNMGVADKNMGNFEKGSVRYSGQITKIKQQHPLFQKKLHQQTGISKRVID